MSSRREVLIRILALLQRKTLIETKKSHFKMALLSVRSIKNVALLTEDGAFALFFLPYFVFLSNVVLNLLFSF